MKDLTLDFDNKRIINSFITNKDLVLQQVKVVVQIWYNDWYLDYYSGIDYKTRFTNKPMLLADLENAILSIDGVTGVRDLNIVESYINLSSNIQARTRTKVYNITGTISLLNENIEIKNGEVTIMGV